MNPKDLVVKCYAELADGQWSAICLDLDLAVQANTLEEARQKLHAMINEYVHDALEGEDKEFGGRLMTRRAPLHLYLKWYLLNALRHMKRLARLLGNGDDRSAFNDVLPVKIA